MGSFHSGLVALGVVVVFLGSCCLGILIESCIAGVRATIRNVFDTQE